MATPLVRLASLDLIRGFVAVGRRMSVTLAAEDLCLTQSAVSRQIHSLEDALGVALFHRGYRSISFTQAGERLFRTADSVVRQLQDTCDTIMRPAERQPVTITAGIGATAAWLLPRLTQLQQRYPSLDVRIAANDKVLDLHTEGIDLALRYASVAHAPTGAKRLFDDSIVPVAHPSLGVSRLDAEALASHALIECDEASGPPLRWSDQLAAAGLGTVAPCAILHFERFEQALQAALAGQGIALGRAGRVDPLIAEGKLVALGTGKGRPGGYAYWLVQADAAPRQEVRDVAQWLLDQARTQGSTGRPTPTSGGAGRNATASESVAGQPAPSPQHSEPDNRAPMATAAMAVDKAAAGQRVALS
ncbi:LysR substrate-binding domain-containing protein [Trinickia soli]|uniref:LysR family transcriptional regulator n=1 Tax=Trinickia soli TaxID=380675 RepID=A0A2N7W5G7_9BURK|nr:LysR substrate-binding domain-containing protein [Trinickia soli]PMS24646.1 LysR family transcriptional regulator [Trinickia soli]CAB3651759.1 Glycine cleavage system transcriptional activator [Trinickia soli]